MSARAGRLVMSGSSSAISDRQMTAMANDRRLRGSGRYILDRDRRASMGKTCESTVPRSIPRSPLSRNSGTYSYVREMSGWSARAVFEEVALGEEFVEFLTIPACQLLD